VTFLVVGLLVGAFLGALGMAIAQTGARADDDLDEARRDITMTLQQRRRRLHEREMRRS
jgi:ElaB/YqjD/DUF883 family membrane-anchored ribosome-binding protein